MSLVCKENNYNSVQTVSPLFVSPNSWFQKFRTVAQYFLFSAIKSNTYLPGEVADVSMLLFSLNSQIKR